MELKRCCTIMHSHFNNGKESRHISRTEIPNLAVWVLWLVFFLTPTTLLAKEDIYWQSVHIPPSSIKKGEQQGTGFVQLILKQLTEQMPEYEHHFPVSTIKKALQGIKDGKNYCHPSLFASAERKPWTHFSQASMFNPNNQLVMTPEQAEQIGQTPVKLASLGTNKDLLYGIIRQRAYGNTIDNFLREYVDIEQRLTIKSEGLTNMFALVAAKKVNVTIAFPFEFYYFTEKRPQYREQLVLRPIDKQPLFIVGHIGCAKNEWGAKVIASANRALDKIKPTNEYKHAMTRWWPKAVLNEEFERFYQEYFLKN